RADLRWVGREPGSGARRCFDEIVASRRPPRHIAKSHRAVADAVHSGWADAGVCIRLAAEEAGLAFFSVRDEAYDLCFPASRAEDPRVQALVRILKSPLFRKNLGELPGYDSSETGSEQPIY